MLVEYFDKEEKHLWGNRSSIPFAIEGYDGLTECPYCRGEIPKINLRDLIDLSGVDKDLEKQNRWIGTFTALTCSQCKWFQVLRSINDSDSTDYGGSVYVRPIIKRFDLTSKQAPVDILANYLSKKGEDIYHIHDKKMEELVMAVFKEHYNCEVVHCGKSGDGGVDLLLVLSEEIVPVQVKRRTKPGMTEPVDTIRNMFGVMYRDQKKRSVIVSTADKFSQNAIEEVNKVIQDEIAQNIELFDLQSFLSILRQYYNGQQTNMLDEAKRSVWLLT